MANKRMFSNSITGTDVFREMPATARCLYYELNMQADDEGFVGSPRSIMKLTGATDDDMRILIAKRYVLVFESGVIVIKHWWLHNYIKKDRIKPTTYVEEKSTLAFDGKGAYVEAENALCPTNARQVPDKCLRSIEEIRLDEISLEENYAGAHDIPPTQNDVETFIREYNYTYVDAEEFMNFYESNGWKVGKNKMKDWQAAVRSWNARKKKELGEEPKPKGAVSYDLERANQRKDEPIVYKPKAERNTPTRPTGSADIPNEHDNHTAREYDAELKRKIAALRNNGGT